jgi:hypothetical protein
MPNIDPKVIFWLSVAIAIAGVGSNAALWGGAIPADYIPILATWNKIISTMGQVVMPLLLGQGMTTAGRLASVQQVPLAQKLDSLMANNPGQVKAIVTTQALADATDSEKVVSSIAAAQAAVNPKAA